MYPNPAACTPPATKRPGESLAAPAAAGQGVCTSQRLRLRRVVSAAIRPGRSSSSRSCFIRSFLPLRIATLAMPMATTTASVIASPVTAVDTSMGMQVLLWGCVMFSASLLAVVIFHWVLVPLFSWIERRFFA